MNIVTISDHEFTQSKIQTGSKLLECGEAYIMKIDHEKITLELPTIDFRGKTTKALPITKGKIDVIKMFIPIRLVAGEYKISEESNEDRFVVYFKDLIPNF
jgi:hypothetical protein